MKTFLKGFIFPLLYCFLSIYTVFPQENNAVNEWIDIHSDNGEFSVQAPAVYDAFFDKDGFTISDGFSTLALSNATVFNSYHDGTLLSFESYSVKNPRKAADVLREGDKRYGKFVDLIAGAGFTSKQILIKNENYHMVRQYLASKTNLYILTTASRDGETKAMRRFLDSLKVGNAISHSKSVAFSDLRMTPVRVEISEKQESRNKTSGNDSQSKDEDPNSKKMVVVSKPRPYYTDAARAQQEQGVVEMRISFTANGGIEGLKILKQLNAGLVRQCAFAAVRMKLLPPEKDGVPVKRTRLVQYSFDIY